MRTDPLPDRVDFRRLATHRALVEGMLPLSALPRLADRLVSTDGQVQVTAQFDRDESGRYRLCGQLEAALPVRCERCLGAMQRMIDQPFCLVAVWSEEEAKQLPDDYEPWVTGEEPVSLAEMVEEELLLSLPLVNYHDTDCTDGVVKPASDEPSPPRQNPFQVLESLRKK